MTKISYINSCYNAARFLDGMIENLLLQDHRDFEIIIVDSKSTDNSIEIARKWMNKDQRIRLIEQPERTPYGVSWLVGWQNATGDIITNSNSDDKSYQWRGSQVVQFYEKNPSRLAFYYGGYETRVNNVVVAKGVPPQYSEDDFSQFFRCGVHVHWNARLAKAVDWDLMFKAANEYRSAFDYWMVLYFISLGAAGVNISSCFSIYNQRPDSIEQSNKQVNTFESLRAITNFYPSGKIALDIENKTKIESPEFYKDYKNFLEQFS